MVMWQCMHSCSRSQSLHSTATAQLFALQDSIEPPSQQLGNSQQRRVAITRRPVYQKLALRPSVSLSIPEAAATASGAPGERGAPSAPSVAGALRRLSAARCLACDDMRHVDAVVLEEAARRNLHCRNASIAVESVQPGTCS